jgi:beta-galactosidase
MRNLTDFLIAIKEADMFAMYRSGPYMCGEWENGGFPAWLFRDPNMKLRSNYTPYLNAVEKYFLKLFRVIHDHQFTVKGGPIIAMQIENEFGFFGNTIKNKADHDYLEFLKNTSIEFGFKELFYTDDGPEDIVDHHGSLPGITNNILTSFSF